VEAALRYPQPQRSLPALETELRAPACAVSLSGISFQPLQHPFWGRVTRSHAWAMDSRGCAEGATPVRAFWPLWPRPAVFPLPDPMPRPIRLAWHAHRKA